MQRHQRQERVLLGSDHDDFAGLANAQTPGFIDFSKTNLTLYSSIFDAPACISTPEAIRSKTAIRSTSVIKLISARPDGGGLRSPKPRNCSRIWKIAGIRGHRRGQFWTPSLARPIIRRRQLGGEHKWMSGLGYAVSASVNTKLLFAKARSTSTFCPS